MPNAASLAAIATATLVTSVDEDRAAGDNFKLPAFLRTTLDAGLADLVEKDNDTALTESDRAGSSKERRDALDALETLIRDGYNHIRAIPSYTITAGQRLALYTAYGWAGGKIADFTDSRLIGLAALAALPKLPGTTAAWLYPADLLTRMAAQLAIAGDEEATATGGARVEATRVRNLALDEVETTISRVRHYYCCASGQVDQTPELLNIGLDPRRDARPAAAPAPVAPAPAGPTG